MNAVEQRVQAIVDRGERVQYGRRVEGATMSLVEAVQSTRDYEDRVEGWRAAQRLLGPATHADFVVRP